MKQLIVNADDFGFTRGVNEGILQAHREGILTATTLMATGDAFDHAVQLARQTPTLDVGCHLVLVGSPGLPATVAQLIQAIALRRIVVGEVLVGQVRRILDAGIRPTHLDTHKHTHLLPAVLNEVARIAQMFGIPWVRRPFDSPLIAVAVGMRKRLVNRGLHFARRRFERVLTDHCCRMTDHFAGFQITGEYDAGSFSRLISILPEGTTEFMCHPGLCTAELRGAPTRLKESREAELRALISDEARSAIEKAEVKLVSYRDVS